MCHQASMTYMPRVVECGTHSYPLVRGNSVPRNFIYLWKKNIKNYVHILYKMQTENPDYYKFRISFAIDGLAPSTPDELVEECERLLKVLCVDPDEGTYTIGWHTHDEFRRKTTPHLHIHFIRTDIRSESSLRKDISKYCKGNPYYIGIIGVKLYSLKAVPEEDVKDLNRLFRYPFKMMHKDGFVRNKFFAGSFDDATSEVSLQAAMAIDEYEREAGKNCDRLEKQMNKSTTYEKYLEHLKERLNQGNPLPVTKLQVQKTLVAFYVAEQMACNSQTIKGYVNTYMLHNKLISIEDWIKQNLD